MKVTLKPFQELFVEELVKKVRNTRRDANEGQLGCIVFSASTGSGKTVMAAALIESLAKEIPGVLLPPALLWVSDQPEINEQTRRRLLHVSEISESRLTTIEGNIGLEPLPRGTVSFVNTQKLSKDKLLVVKGDSRPKTFWDIIADTLKAYGPSGLVVIIDEAHRGIKPRPAAEASLVQAFFNGRDTMPAVPVIIGMSATPERLNAYLDVNPHRSRHFVAVPVSAVRESGLLKDRIAIYNAAEGLSDYAILAKSAERWKQSIASWRDYSLAQNQDVVEPLLVVQVLDRPGPLLGATATDLDAAIGAIEGVVGPMSDRSFAHAFDNGGVVGTSSGRQIRFVDASQLSGDLEVKVVFFKQSLATGWDCPRAEVMMSFRPARDATFITQLIGRIVRTPLARRIDDNDALNQVDLFLPHYDAEQVEAIVKLLTSDFGIEVENSENSEPVMLWKDDRFKDAVSAIQRLKTATVPNRTHIPARSRVMRLAAILCGNGASIDAPLIWQQDVIRILDKRFDEVCSGLALDGKSGIAVKLVSLSGDVLEDAAIDVRLSDSNVDQILLAVEPAVTKGFANQAVRHLVTSKKISVRQAKVAFVLLASAVDVQDEIESLAVTVFQQFCKIADSHVSSWPDRDRTRYSELLELSPTPVMSFLIVPEVITGDNVPPDPRFRFLHVDRDALAGRYRLNRWEELALERLFSLFNVQIVFRNPSNGSMSLSIPYEIDRRWRTFHPDFIAYGENQGKPGVVISEPHRSDYRDFLSKAKALSQYCLTFPEQVLAAEMITSWNGNMYSLRLDGAERCASLLRCSEIFEAENLFELIDSRHTETAAIVR